MESQQLHQNPHSPHLEYMLRVTNVGKCAVMAGKLFFIILVPCCTELQFYN